MSCFTGETNEYPGVSLDRFDGANLQSVVYLLSHCHSDHMVGLDAPAFADRLTQNPSIKLYGSSVSRSLLSGMPRYQHLRPLFHTIPCDEEHTLPVPSSENSTIGNGPARNIAVTLIPAGHCPGSVMFLIQGDAGNVLYTGDFRYHVGDTSRLHSLQGVKIRSVYVDTTFCIPRAFRIPSREECKELMLTTISDWFKGNPDRRVHIYSRCNYGYEFLMIALAEHYKCKIHVNTLQYERYRFFPRLHCILTSEANASRIHFCHTTIMSHKRFKNNSSLLPCSLELQKVSEVLQIIPSVMYFTKSWKVSTEGMAICESANVIRMCYSSHSSYEEILDFLEVIKPELIFPSVRPNLQLTLADVRASLSYLECANLDSTRTNTSRPYVPFIVHDEDLSDGDSDQEVLSALPVLQTTRKPRAPLQSIPSYAKFNKTRKLFSMNFDEPEPTNIMRPENSTPDSENIQQSIPLEDLAESNVMSVGKWLETSESVRAAILQSAIQFLSTVQPSVPLEDLVASEESFSRGIVDTSTAFVDPDAETLSPPKSLPDSQQTMSYEHPEEDDDYQQPASSQPHPDSLPDSQQTMSYEHPEEDDDYQQPSSSQPHPASQPEPRWGSFAYILAQLDEFKE